MQQSNGGNERVFPDDGRKDDRQGDEEDQGEEGRGGVGCPGRVRTRPLSPTLNGSLKQLNEKGRVRTPRLSFALNG